MSIRTIPEGQSADDLVAKDNTIKASPSKSSSALGRSRHLKLPLITSNTNSNNSNSTVDGTTAKTACSTISTANAPRVAIEVAFEVKFIKATMFRYVYGYYSII